MSNGTTYYVYWNKLNRSKEQLRIYRGTKVEKLQRRGTKSSKLV